MGVSTLVQEAIVVGCRYAQRLRSPSAVEQHMHSFLEVLLFTPFARMCYLYPQAAKLLFSRHALSSRFALKPKRNAESPAYLAAVLVLGTLALVRSPHV